MLDNRQIGATTAFFQPALKTLHQKQPQSFFSQKNQAKL